ncbi:MAG: hypothetical protein HQM12_04065 [SAR324 cluster bacterium]|nr:hypothetical protein [SAR324 cluster bacterium]
MIILWGLTYLLSACYLSRKIFGGAYFSIGLPFAVMIVGFVVLHKLGVSISHITQGHFIGFVTLSGFLFWWGYREINFLKIARQHIPFMVLLLAIFLYQYLYQGAYLELPADVYGVHLYRIGDLLNEGRFVDFSKSLSANTMFYPYLIHATLIRYAPYELMTALNESSAVFTMLLIISVYAMVFFFTRHSIISTLAVVLSCLTWGVDIYSFYRYYTFAPAFFCMTLVFDGLVLSWLYFQKLPINWWSALIRFGSILFLFLIASFFSHKQEALFLGILFCFATLFFCLSRYRDKTLTWWTGIHGGIVLLTITIMAVLAPRHVPDVNNSIFYDWGQWFGVRWVSANLLNQADLNIVSVSMWFLVLYSLVSLCLLRGLPQKRYLYFYWFSWIPLLLIAVPPTATLFATLLDDRLYNRLFYMSTLYGSSAVLIVHGYKILCPLKSTSIKQIAVGLFLLMPIFYYSMKISMNGKGTHFFKRMEPAHNHVQWQPVYDFLKAQPKHAHMVLTDGITEYPLLITSGFYSNDCNGSIGRCYFPDPKWRSVTIPNQLAHQYDYIVINRGKDFQSSGFEKHWDSKLFVSHVRNTSQYYPPNTEQELTLLETHGTIKKVFQWENIGVYSPPLNE